VGRLVEKVKTRIRRSGSAFGGDQAAESWPALSFVESQPTLDTLHHWTQIVGKTRLALSPSANHWWHVPLYVTARGLSTLRMPYGPRSIEIAFDLVDHQLRIATDDAEVASIELEARSVADFYHAYRDALHSLDVAVHIWPVPVEVEDHVRFDRDNRPRKYEGRYARAYWEILAQTDRVLQLFRQDYLGKCSPIHFFWGGFDLAHTRFSGRRAPLHPGGIPNTPDFIARESYSHECWSCGFWNGNQAVPYPAFYAYAYPEPEGFPKARVQPATAFFSKELGEFILPYDAVRSAPRPTDTLLGFLHQTYEAAAQLGEWNRKELERK